MNQTCEVCGAQLPDDATVCPSCGAATGYSSGQQVAGQHAGQQDSAPQESAGQTDNTSAEQATQPTQPTEPLNTLERPTQSIAPAQDFWGQAPSQPALAPLASSQPSSVQSMQPIAMQPIAMQPIATQADAAAVADSVDGILANSASDQNAQPESSDPYARPHGQSYAPSVRPMDEQPYEQQAQPYSQSPQFMSMHDAPMPPIYSRPQEARAPLLTPRMKGALVTIAQSACFCAVLAMISGLLFAVISLLLCAIPLSQFSSYMSDSIGANGLSSSGSSLLGGAGSGLGPLSGMEDDLAQVEQDLMPNVFTMIMLMFALGTGGTASANYSASMGGLGMLGMDDMSITAKLTVTGMLGLVGVAMLVAAAFGTYVFARSGKASSVPWSRMAAAMASGLLSMGLYSVLASVGSHHKTSSLFILSLTSDYSGLTPRTLVMIFVLVYVGAFVGFHLGNKAQHAQSVFHAAWRWSHRQEGARRTVIESLFMLAVVFGVAGFIYSILLTFALCSYGRKHQNVGSSVWFFDNPLSTWCMVVPMVPAIMVMLFFLCVGGAEQMQVVVNGIVSDPSGDFAPAGSGAMLGDFPFLGSYWFKWVTFATFVVFTLYLALRAGYRYRQDARSARWGDIWKTPLALMIIAGILQLSCFMGQCSASLNAAGLDFLGLSGSQSDVAQVKFLPSWWCFLGAGAWGLVVEVLARTAGVVVAAHSRIGAGGRVFAGGSADPLDMPGNEQPMAYAQRFGAYQGAPIPADDQGVPAAVADPAAQQQVFAAQGASMPPTGYGWAMPDQADTAFDRALAGTSPDQQSMTVGGADAAGSTYSSNYAGDDAWRQVEDHRGEKPTLAPTYQQSFMESTPGDFWATSAYSPMPQTFDAAPSAGAAQPAAVPSDIYAPNTGVASPESMRPATPTDEADHPAQMAGDDDSAAAAGDDPQGSAA